MFLVCTVVLDDEEGQGAVLHPGQVHVARHPLPPGDRGIRLTHPRHHQDDPHHPRVRGEQVQAVQQRPHQVRIDLSSVLFPGVCREQVQAVQQRSHQVRIDLSSVLFS